MSQTIVQTLCLIFLLTGDKFANSTQHYEIGP